MCIHVYLNSWKTKTVCHDKYFHTEIEKNVCISKKRSHVCQTENGLGDYLLKESS